MYLCVCVCVCLCVCVQGMDEILETLDNMGIKCFVGCTERTSVLSFVILLFVYAVQCQCQCIADFV